MSTYRNNIFAPLRALFRLGSIEPLQAPTVQPTRRLQHRLKRVSRPRIELAIDRLEAAIQMAESAEQPRRYHLYLMYYQAMRDEQLLAQVRIWTERVLRERSVMVDRSRPVGDRFVRGVGDRLEKKWFYDFQRYALMSWLWGHSLIEFDTRMVDGQFTSCTRIPPEHVRPEYGDILLSPHDSTGVPYRSGALQSLPLIEVGDPYELGLLQVLTRTVLKKQINHSDWMRRNEKYGMPFLVVLTQSDDPRELDAKEEMASSFGSNGYAILDDTDELKMLESGQAFTYQTFRDFGTLMDEYISKIVNGAVLGESSDGGSRAKEEVGERTMDAIGLATMRWLEFVVNDSLFPMLRRFGYDLPETLRWEYYLTTEEAEEQAREERMGGAAGKYDGTQDVAENAEPDSEPEPEPAPEPQKKKLTWPDWSGRSIA